MQDRIAVPLQVLVHLFTKHPHVKLAVILGVAAVLCYLMYLVALVILPGLFTVSPHLVAEKIIELSYPYVRETGKDHLIPILVFGIGVVGLMALFIHYAYKCREGRARWKIWRDSVLFVLGVILAAHLDHFVTHT